MIRARVQKVTADAIHPLILNDDGMPARAALLDIRTLAIGVPVRAANGRAHVLDARARLLADPHEEHSFDGREVAVGLRVVALGDALAVAAGEQMVAHDPAAAFAVGGFKGFAARVGARGPGGREPGGVVGVLGEGGAPFVVGQGRVPGFAQVVDLVEGGGAGGAGAGRRGPGVAVGGVAGAGGGAAGVFGDRGGRCGRR